LKVVGFVKTLQLDENRALKGPLSQERLVGESDGKEWHDAPVLYTNSNRRSEKDETHKKKKGNDDRARVTSDGQPPGEVGVASKNLYL